MAAPSGVADPTVVVLTPGVYNSAFYEHALLARLMGVHLVEGRDLVCHGTDVFLRTTEGEVPVHVIYRRVDDDFIDPLQFRPDSLVGCPGLLNAARAGRVTVANAVGNGIADDKLVYAYVPEMIRYYLDEDPVLQNVETFHLVDDRQRDVALRRRSELVFKRVDGSGGKGLVIGPHATGPELDELAAEVERSPRDWVAQRMVALSTSPSWVGGSMAPRHVDLRPFAVNDGERIWVLPGGLTRVALQEGGLVVNSSQGGGSKDTWVVGQPGPAARRTAPASRLAVTGAARARSPDRGRSAHGRRAAGRRRAGPAAVSNALLSRVAESIFWVGRYVERAEGTARILDVVVYQALEQSGAEADAAAERLLAVMGLPPDGDEADPLAGHRAAGPRPREPLVDRRRPQRRPGEHPGRAPRDPRRAVGEDQRHVVRPPPPVGAGPPGRSGLLPGLRQDPDGRHHRAGRHHHEQGPDVALLHPRPVPGADRRGGPPAGLPLLPTTSPTAGW